MNCKDCCYNLPKDGHPYCTYEDGECVKISVLEKENAELKKQLGMSNKVYNDNLDYSHHIEEQFTNAKEIIREYMRFESMIGTCSFYSEEYEKTKTKAEAFLKE